MTSSVSARHTAAAGSPTEISGRNARHYQRPLGLAVTASGRFSLTQTSDSVDAVGGVDPEVAARIEAAFQDSLPGGLLSLATRELGTALTPSLAFGRTLATGLVRALCLLPEEGREPKAIRRLQPDAGWVASLLAAVPPMHGAEYLDAEGIKRAWSLIMHHVAELLEQDHRGLSEFLDDAGGDWHGLGRVWLHLAENKKNDERPFAFLATYTPARVGAGGSSRHIPLGQALEELTKNREALMELLQPVQRAASRSALVKELLDSGDIFQPIAWTAEEAFAFLREAEGLDGTGIMLRLPKAWRVERPKSPKVQVRIGESPPLGKDSLLDFDVALALDGEPLTAEERRALLRGTARLEWLRGRWVEVDPAELRATLDAWAERQRSVGFQEGLRVLAGAGDDTSWADVRAGQWLQDVLGRLEDPKTRTPVVPSKKLKATLRPYQRDGLAWLALLEELGLGGCLADDMGLGKTIQVIALLLHMKGQKKDGPSLIVVPASLVGNWSAELLRFAPSLKVAIAHRGHAGADGLERALDSLDSLDVVLTTYGTLPRVPQLLDREYPLVVIDEAQAIKNAETRQSKTVKKLKAKVRLALTGTPIENRIGDLWSLFDFVSPGLLGSPTKFRDLLGKLQAADGPGFAPLRRLVRPYILRRSKTDKSIIDDLPDKTEVNVYCALSKKQAVLYEESVRELERALQELSGMQRRGIVLAFLTRFKQICNHPSHWLSDGEWNPSDSGKLDRLSELVDVISARQEKLLVFTQYREATGPLNDFLHQRFERPGLVLHGGTPVKARAELVRRFQEEDGPPFFVLSLKAGGTGLNLTQASHVVHFDRWWNPAVENQATDRAFRIGQHKNVLVHRFVCQGTLEERIDAMLEAKRSLAEEILSADGGQMLTEMSNEELLAVVKLDVSAALSGEES